MTQRNRIKTLSSSAVQSCQRAAFPVGCHTWRATGITIYLENDGRLEHAQQMAGHESPRTTKLYDRTKDEITLSEVERIRL
jgi:integrase